MGHKSTAPTFVLSYSAVTFDRSVTHLTLREVRMRRVASIVLLTLGVFAVVLGVLLRFYIHSALGVAPLDPATTTVATGTGVTVFYPGDLKQRTDATVTATRQV